MSFHYCACLGNLSATQRGIQAASGSNRNLTSGSQMTVWGFRSPNLLENTGIILFPFLFWQKLFSLCILLYAEAEDFIFLWLALQMMH